MTFLAGGFKIGAHHTTTSHRRAGADVKIISHHTTHQTSHHSSHHSSGGSGGSIDVKGKWISISYLDTPCLREIVNIAVEEHNTKYEDYLKWNSISLGWYEDLEENKVKYRFHIQTTDCLGRVRPYEIIVLEEKVAGKRIWTLESCQPI